MSTPPPQHPGKVTLTTPGKVQNRLATIGQHLQLPLGRRPLPQVMRQLHMLDAFLDRLARSPYHQQLVLGGGLFLFKLTLSASGALRPTQDADFTCLLPNDPSLLRQAFAHVVSAPQGASRLSADFVVFAETAITIQPIMGTAPRGGQRVVIPAQLGPAQEAVTVDLAFGTLLAPGPYLRNVPTILDPTVFLPIWTAPLEVILAGKVVSMLKHGASNTRFKDYFDVWSLAHTQDFQGDVLVDTLLAACLKEGVAPTAPSPILQDPTFVTDPQQLLQWQNYLVREGLVSRAPTFADAITLLRALYGPVRIGTARGMRWEATAQRWV